MTGKYCLLLLAYFSSARAEVNLTRHFYDRTEDPLLLCNDGSTGGYYIREATSEHHTDKWIFYLEGGGWCWNSTSCLNRLVLNGILFGGSSLVSSSHWPPTKTFEDGIFLMEAGGWAEANLVYLPYCSSDAHMGDTQELTGELGTIQYRGRRLVREAISRLVGQKPVQRIVFGGTSAGGRGSMVLIDGLGELLHPTTKVWGAHDSGAYQDIPPYDRFYYPFGDQCRDAFAMYQPPISSECADLHLEEFRWKCVCGEYMLPHVMTPSQVFLYTYDSYQLGNDLGTSPKHWTPDMCEYAEDLFIPGMENTVESLAASDRHLVYGAACYRHGVLMSPEWRQLRVAGISPEEQLLAWLEHDIRTQVRSSCAGVNCQETCPQVEIGVNAHC